MIVPLVGFDRYKFRLGYGGGFYDRYISKILRFKKILTVGFAFSFQEISKIPVNSEISCLDVLEILEKKNFKISLPITKRNNNMDFYEWSFQNSLRVSHQGIPEPNPKKKVIPDVLIVPLVGFDRHKFRLGYGGGFYDRYISKILKFKKIFTVGFAFSFQEISKIPINKFDQKLNFILTDKEIIK